MTAPPAAACWPALAVGPIPAPAIGTGSGNPARIASSGKSGADVGHTTWSSRRPIIRSRHGAGKVGAARPPHFARVPGSATGSPRNRMPTWAGRINERSAGPSEPCAERLPTYRSSTSAGPRPCANRARQSPECSGYEKAGAAVARKLAVLLHRFWRHGTGLRWTVAPVAALAAQPRAPSALHGANADVERARSRKDDGPRPDLAYRRAKLASWAPTRDGRTRRSRRAPRPRRCRARRRHPRPTGSNDARAPRSARLALRRRHRRTVGVIEA